MQTCQPSAPHNRLSLQRRIQALEQRLTALEGNIVLVPVPKHDSAAVAQRAKELVAARFRISIAQLESPSRITALVRPRFVAIWLIRKFTELTTSEIARLFHRHHTAITHALGEMPKWLATDASTRDLLADIETQFCRLLT